MAKLDFAGLKADLHADIYGRVSTWLPGGVRQSNEYVVTNPTRADAKKGSFKVNLRTGQWADFATDQKGGDLISLYAYVFCNDNQGEAYKKLQGGNPDAAPAVQRRNDAKKKAAPEETFTPLPLPADAPDMPAPKGKPERVTVYRDASGRPLLRICMYRNKQTGNKTPLPTSWGRRVWPKTVKDEGGKEVYAGEMFDRVSWHNKNWPSGRPILNLDQLAARPTDPVVVGEGEKVAERLAKARPLAIATTWSAGALSVAKSDWNTLFGREVTLCPDYDLAGQKAMLEIAHLLKAQQCKVRMIWEPLEAAAHPEGWDLADEPDDAKLNAMIDAALDIEVVERLILENEKLNAGKGSVAGKHGKLATSLPAEVLLNQNELRCLGYGGDNKVYFICRQRGVVTALGPDQLGNINHLFSLMPKDFWYDLFPDKQGGIDKHKCSDTLQRWADNVGYFDPDIIRGSGVWRETNGDFVFHMGQKLLVGDRLVAINEYQSEFMYEATRDLGLHREKPLATEQAKQLLEICSWLDWGTNLDAVLLAGFCMVAPMCGGLDWRPHIWVTGESGSGKTTVIKNIIAPVLGKVCLHLLGDSSAPGIRQTLGTDALPVIIDEIEAEEPQQMSNVQAILQLARKASSDTGARTVKGGAQGEPLDFKVRSCFVLSAISVNVSKMADKNRISVLQLKPAPLGLSEDALNARYDKFQEYVARVEAVLTPAFVNGLHMRAYALLPIIRQSAKVFGQAINARLNSQRIGDQLGILCAGAWALQSKEVVTPQVAREWVDKYAFEAAAPIYDKKEHEVCLDYILQSVVKLPNSDGHGAVERTLGELVATVADNEIDSKDNTTESHRVLQRCGLKVDLNAKTLAIANSHSYLERIMSKTSYPVWSRLLPRIEGAMASAKPMRFSAADVSRATILPLKVVLNREDKTPVPVPMRVAEF